MIHGDVKCFSEKKDKIMKMKLSTYMPYEETKYNPLNTSILNVCMYTGNVEPKNRYSTYTIDINNCRVNSFTHWPMKKEYMTWST